MHHQIKWNDGNRWEIVLFVFRSGFKIEKLPPDIFNASEATTKDLFRLCASVWNGGVHTVLRLAEGRDWNLLFKVTISSILANYFSFFLFWNLDPSFAKFVNSMSIVEYRNCLTFFWILQILYTKGPSVK